MTATPSDGSNVTTGRRRRRAGHGKPARSRARSGSRTPGEGWARAANRALEEAGRAERIDHRTLAAQHAEALERGELDRAAELDPHPWHPPGPGAIPGRARRPFAVVEMAAAIERSNRADRAELAEHRSQVECAEAEVRDLEQQIRALDSEISAARRRAAWERIRTRPAAGLKAGVQWIRERLGPRPGARKRMERESPAREIER